MPPQLLSLIIFGVQQLIAHAPEIAAEISALLTKTEPTADDWKALHDKVAAKSYRDYVPASALPPVAAPAAPGPVAAAVAAAVAVAPAVAPILSVLPAAVQEFSDLSGMTAAAEQSAAAAVQAETPAPAPAPAAAPAAAPAVAVAPGASVNESAV